MIGKLKGIIDRIENSSVLLDVNGVGYIVFASAKTLQNLPSEGEATSLLIETHVREDHIHLYGFLEEAEQQWFNTLTTVSGVGAKVALAILSGLTPDDLSTALLAQDKAMLTRVSGVGPKLAARLLTELKDKATQIASGPIVLPAKKNSPQHSALITQHFSRDAVSALTNLGYGQAEAYQAVTRLLASNENVGVEELIRLSLKELSR